MRGMIALFALGGLFKLLFMLIAAAVGLALFVFWIWMLVHAITNQGLNDTEKIMWVLVIIFLHFLGALIYLAIGRPKGIGGIG